MNIIVLIWATITIVNLAIMVLGATRFFAKRWGQRVDNVACVICTIVSVGAPIIAISILFLLSETRGRG